MAAAQSPAVTKADMERIVGASMTRNSAMDF